MLPYPGNPTLKPSFAWFVPRIAASRPLLRLVGPMVVLGLATPLSGCIAPALRPAHSLEKGELRFAGVGFYDMTAGGPRFELSESGDADIHLPFDLEVRAGLGKGWEFGWKSTAPVGADFKYALLDERRHATPLSVAVDVDAGINSPFFILDIFGNEWTIAVPAPFLYAGAGALVSANVPLSASVAVRPTLNVGLRTGLYLEGLQPIPSDPRVVRVAAGIEVPFRVQSTRSVAPQIGAAWEHTLSGGENGIVWLGLAVEPWLAP